MFCRIKHHVMYMTCCGAKENDRNHMLNFFKGIACMGVVFIHIAFPGRFGQIVSKVAQFAVPLFIMIAGYYSYGCNENKIKNRLYKVIKILLYGYICFFIYNAVVEYCGGSIRNWILSNFTITNLIKGIVFCTVDFAVPLWYLIAMVEVYIVWLLIVKKNKERQCIKVMPFLFVGYVILTTICESMNLDWYIKINFATRAMSWFLLGYYIHITENEKDIFKNTSLIIMAIAGCIVSLLPIVFDTKIQFSSLGIVLYASALFVIAVNNSDVCISKTVEFIGDRLSMNIYIFHVLVAGVLDFVFKRVKCINSKSDLYSWIFPIVTLIVTIAWSTVLYKVSDSVKRKWM